MPNSKARNRPGVKLGGTLILFTVLFGLVDRHVFIYKSVRTFFHPNRACGEAERFVSRGDSAGAFPLSPVQKTKVLGTETQVPESSRLVSSSGELFAWWADVLNASSRFSKIYCESFILYSILVQHANAEDRLTKTPLARPRISAKRCAVILALRVLPEASASEPDSAAYWLQKFENTERRLEGLGWKVFSANCPLPRALSRRVSRIPKLSPGVFFPNTERVLYSDLKYLRTISKVEASALARVLLQGTRFGIVQHAVSDDLASEGTHIEVQVERKRPTMIDDLDVMREQISSLQAALSAEEQKSFAIEGGLHARVLQGDVSSSILDALWFEEYAHGCDRDQIAFFGAAARAGLRRVYPFSCQDRFDRAGVYRSDFDGRFTVAMHCTLSHVLACARSWA